MRIVTEQTARSNSRAAERLDAAVKQEKAERIAGDAPLRIWEASNKSNVVTHTAGAVAQDIPGCSIVIPPTDKMVVVEGFAVLYQSLAGTGQAYFRLLETTTVEYADSVHALPGILNHYLGTMVSTFTLMPSAATRVVKIQVSLLTTDGARASAINNFVMPSTLRASER